MTALLKNVTNCIWHAFDSLQNNQVVHKSKLKFRVYSRDGKRNRGRPYRRWEDDIKQTAGPNWRRVAHDRKQWRELEEAFANRQSETRDIMN
ncbi:jg11261 [Pararge aegeria aegeria]|uniref:Jg11261 protein n=1 Tax=Pararge aegeria aegeria TaxID=348720 RepID=A0A8S4RJB8_9NEOP|nr:jg11261 [Pararge aegeria aegeria]